MFDNSRSPWRSLPWHSLPEAQRAFGNRSIESIRQPIKPNRIDYLNYFLSIVERDVHETLSKCRQCKSSRVSVQKSIISVVIKVASFKITNYLLRSVTLSQNRKLTNIFDPA
jgi:hypothetical protein